MLHWYLQESIKRLPGGAVAPTGWVVAACRASVRKEDATFRRSESDCPECRARCLHCHGTGHGAVVDCQQLLCADCGGSGMAADDPFDPMHRETSLSGARAQRNAANGVARCVDCDAPYWPELDGAPASEQRCVACAGEVCCDV